jgi:Tol biopolymer transport system component
MNMDGSNQIQLTDGASKNYPAISTDGKWVLYNTTNDWRLWKVPIEGGESVRLTQYPASFPSVSPDGKTVACLARTEPRRELSIVVVSIEGGQPLKRIDVDGAGFSNDRIQWTSDGAYLLYAAERDGPTFIVKQPVNGGPGEEVLSFDTGVMFDFGYSFDGQLFAVTRGEWQHDIVLIDGLNRN